VSRPSLGNNITCPSDPSTLRQLVRPTDVDRAVTALLVAAEASPDLAVDATLISRIGT
jgi:hypothetical protein